VNPIESNQISPVGVNFGIVRYDTRRESLMVCACVNLLGSLRGRTGSDDQ
jgi:hypothetical protein